MALVEDGDFQHILRLYNTNVKGEHKVMFAITKVRGIGRRFANIVLKKADVDMNKRAGELTSEEVNKIQDVIQHPLSYKVPVWMLNRKRDMKTGKNMHIISNGLDTKLREDFERMRKIRTHRGIRHMWLLKVRGQHTKTTGRAGRTVGVAMRKKKFLCLVATQTVRPARPVVREDFERMRKIRTHRGIRHMWLLKVRGQVRIDLLPRRFRLLPDTSALLRTFVNEIGHGEAWGCKAV
eukprot:CAMPEP_0119157188 /NCGR_PEP_ID=MMETSP1310-20130426/52625_1 /TAXON_ID=464262 /ORGANISM="Genus nov. species nov., Strain RCC2339" /LENGTH=236 /DNA_ID=CAMNT_0007149803 /DNA_START=81 /DNA_END=792 /DNA_ORIENTATION=-